MARLELDGLPAKRPARLLRCLLAALLFAFGCAHDTLVVRAPVQIPARVPVRAFPSIWVSGGVLDDEAYLLDRLASHLAKSGQSEVRRVDIDELEPARKEGRISQATVVILLELELRNDDASVWDTAPVQYCGYYGCSTQYQSYLTSVPTLVGEVVLTVYEGPTARVLQREELSESAVGEDTGLARKEVVELLARNLEHAVDVLELKERIELYRVDLPEVKDALAAIRRGDWQAGRQRLEAAAGALGGHKPKTQAKVWYNLGIARWLAPGPEGLTEEGYQAAARALRWAARLDKHPVHSAALQRLKQAREDHVLLEQQRRATRHNFRVLRAAPPVVPAEVPPPPAPPGSPEQPAASAPP